MSLILSLNVNIRASRISSWELPDSISESDGSHGSVSEIWHHAHAEGGHPGTVRASRRASETEVDVRVDAGGCGRNRFQHKWSVSVHDM